MKNLTIFKVKIKIFLFIIIKIINSELHSQTMNFQWAYRAGGYYDEKGRAIDTDSNGNVYIAGTFFSPFIYFGSTTLTNKGSGDIYLCKYDPIGNLIWAKSFGTVNNEGIDDIKIKSNNEILITGYYFNDTIHFDSFSLVNQGQTNTFVCDLDNNGNTLWAKSFGGNLQDYGYAITCDKSNNVYFTGSFESNSIIFGSNTIINKGMYDFYIAKLDSIGQPIWINSFGGSKNDYAYEINCDNSNNVYLTGTFESDSIIVSSTLLVNNFISNMYTIKYDSFGNLIWANSPNSVITSEISGTGLFNDKYGNTYVSGMFSGSINFGAIQLISNGGEDIFLVKYDSNGIPIYAKSFGGSSRDFGYKLHSDSIGNVSITGLFYSPNIAFGTTLLTNSGVASFFVSQFDYNGNPLWSKGSNSTVFSTGLDIKIDKFGDLYIIGEYESQLSFGNYTYNNAGTGMTKDVFFAKLSGNNGIKLNENKLFVSVFPNPCSESINLKFQNFQINTDINLFDNLGKAIFTTKFTGENLKIDVNKLFPGIYFLQINNSIIGETKVNKVIIE